MHYNHFKYYYFLLFIVCSITTSANNLFYNIRDFGAKGDGVALDSQAINYPEPAKMGIMPAYGFFIRHVKGIKMSNVEVSFLGKEVRPAFYLEDVNGANFSRLKAMPAEGTKTFVLNNILNFTIEQSEGVKNKKLEKLTSTSF